MDKSRQVDYYPLVKAILKAEPKLTNRANIDYFFKHFRIVSVSLERKRPTAPVVYFLHCRAFCGPAETDVWIEPDAYTPKIYHTGKPAADEPTGFEYVTLYAMGELGRIPYDRFQCYLKKVLLRYVS